MSTQRLPITQIPDSETLRKFKDARRQEALKLARAAGITDIIGEIPHQYLLLAYQQHYRKTNEHLIDKEEIIQARAGNPRHIARKHDISFETSEEPHMVITFRAARTQEAREFLLKNKPAYAKVNTIPANIFGPYIAFANEQHYADTGEKLIFNPVTQKYAISRESEEVMAFRAARNHDAEKFHKDFLRPFGENVGVAHDEHYRQTGEKLEFNPETNQYAVSKAKNWVPRKSYSAEEFNFPPPKPTKQTGWGGGAALRETRHSIGS